MLSIFTHHTLYQLWHASYLFMSDLNSPTRHISNPEKKKKEEENIYAELSQLNQLAMGSGKLQAKEFPT